MHVTLVNNIILNLKVFINEVPEIQEGTVKIVAVSREANEKMKEIAEKIEKMGFKPIPILPSAITALLAKGYKLVEAVKKAKIHVEYAIRYGPPIGRGWCPADPLASLEIDAERYRVLTDIVEAVKKLERASHLVSKYVPETGMQVAMSLPARYASSPFDVAAIPGRIRASCNRLIYKLPPEFGVSSHLARAILTAMEFQPDIRAAINIAYSSEIIRAAEKLGYIVSYYDRREEPPELKRVEGATIPWGIRRAVEKVGGKVPDIVYHLGDVGYHKAIPRCSCQRRRRF
ncbi:MAG TPA: hypothetical protein EYP08_08895 [Pyrodictiaceae archaeon]|nr:hypothetical protein [Pyrodictiaceae archaeon]